MFYLKQIVLKLKLPTYAWWDLTDWSTLVGVKKNNEVGTGIVDKIFYKIVYLTKKDPDPHKNATDPQRNTVLTQNAIKIGWSV